MCKISKNIKVKHDSLKYFLSKDLFVKDFGVKKSSSPIKNTKIHDYTISNKGKVVHFTNKEIKEICNDISKTKYKDIIKKRIMYIHDRYKNITSKNNCDWKWDDFFEWWCKQDKCYYCGTTKEDYYKLYCNSSKVNDFKISGKLIRSKKRSFNSYNFEVDRKIPNRGYNSTNCVLACHLCNNAKSDMIHPDDFKPIARGISEYIKNLNKK